MTTFLRGCFAAGGFDVVLRFGAAGVEDLDLCLFTPLAWRLSPSSSAFLLDPAFLERFASAVGLSFLGGGLAIVLLVGLLAAFFDVGCAFETFVFADAAALLGGIVLDMCPSTGEQMDVMNGRDRTRSLRGVGYEKGWTGLGGGEEVR